MKTLLVGHQFGTVDNSSASGTLSQLYAPNANNDGGLVGELSGGTVSYSHATGDVYGSDANNGGLVGRANGGNVTDSYAEGNVFGAAKDDGGLIGKQTAGTVTDTYATGTPGGGGATLGGLVADQTGGTVTSSYYDNSNDSLSGGPGTSESATSMTQQGTFSGWNFTTVWSISKTVNDGFPTLLPPSTPAGQVPEVPWAAALPLVGLAGWFTLQRRRGLSQGR
jgi:hypothetical protein